MPFLPYLYAVPPISLCRTRLNALIFNVFLPRKILKTLKIIKNGAFTRAAVFLISRKTHPQTFQCQTKILILNFAPVTNEREHLSIAAVRAHESVTLP